MGLNFEVLVVDLTDDEPIKCRFGFGVFVFKTRFFFFFKKVFSILTIISLNPNQHLKSHWLCATLLLLQGFSYSSPISKLPWLPLLQLFPNPSLHLPLLLTTEPPTTMSTMSSWVSDSKILAWTSPITSPTLWQRLDSAPSDTTNWS